MSILESINDNGFVKILDKIDVDDVKDTATIIKDVSEIVSETKKKIIPSRTSIIDTIKYKFEDFKYWCQLRLTDVEFCYNMAKAELQVDNLDLYCKFSIIMMIIFILIHVIALVLTV